MPRTNEFTPQVRILPPTQVWIELSSVPQIAADNNLKVASLIDLAGTKASVVQVRAEAKDYVDAVAFQSAP